MKTILRLLLFSLALCASLTAQISQAAVFERDWKTPGDGLLTYDDVNQREWLDLTESQLFKFPGNTLEERYQAVLAETAIDGLFEGFSVAASEEVRSLAESAGIDTSTLSFLVNAIPSDALIGHLSNTLSDSTPNARSGGFVTPPSSLELASVWFVYNPNSRDKKSAGYRDLSGTLEPKVGFFGPPPFVSSSGVWLHRIIPEPSCVSLAISAFVLLLTLKLR